MKNGGILFLAAVVRRLMTSLKCGWRKLTAQLGPFDKPPAAPTARSYTSLGQRPRNHGPREPLSANGAAHLRGVAWRGWRRGIRDGKIERAFSPRRGCHSIPGALPQAGIKRAVGPDKASAIAERQISLCGSSCSPHQGLRLPLLRSERRRGSGRGGAPQGWAARKGEAPLSPALSPFVPHGARETNALLVTAVPARTFATIENVAGFALCALVWCGFAPQANAEMTAADVTNVLAQAVSRAAVISPASVIAVVDREGFVLGVWSVNGLVPAGTNTANAIAKAGTAAFLSSGQNAFTSRTAGFIVQQNFPPGVNNKPPGPLVGVNFSQLAFSDINKYKLPAEAALLFLTASPAAPLTQIPTPPTGGLAGTAGGVPLYKAGALVGGVGVAGDGDDSPFNISQQSVIDAKVDEDVALAGQIGFEPSPRIRATKVFLDGIALPYVASTTALGVVKPLGRVGTNVAGFAPTSSPAVRYMTNTMGGVTGEIRQSIIGDPSLVDLPGKTARLTAAEVTAILTAGANRARTTRAGIRLPRGVPMQVFITVVNNPNVPGSPPVCLGTFCTSPDTTRFSWDVAVQKARTAVFFSSDARAFSSRAVGFMAESHFPPGIGGTAPGLFLGLQERFSIITPTGSTNATNPLNGAVFMTATNVNPNLPNGITIFPGGFPLYRNGVLIGAIGVSGDGIDQDDLVGASGAALFPPPEPVRSDRWLHRGVRLPFAKFPRNPAL